MGELQSRAAPTAPLCDPSTVPQAEVPVICPELVQSSQTYTQAGPVVKWLFLTEFRILNHTVYSLSNLSLNHMNAIHFYFKHIKIQSNWLLVFPLLMWDKTKEEYACGFSHSIACSY